MCTVLYVCLVGVSYLVVACVRMRVGGVLNALVSLWWHTPLWLFVVNSSGVLSTSGSLLWRLVI